MGGNGKRRRRGEGRKAEIREAGSRGRFICDKNVGLSPKAKMKINVCAINVSDDPGGANSPLSCHHE